MATLPTSGYFGLADAIKLLNPDGSVATVAEVLNTSSDLMRAVYVFEGNLPLGHKSVLRTSLPPVTPRQYYKGTPSTRSTVGTQEDTITILEQRPQIDELLARLGGNLQAQRFSESKAHVEAMTQEYHRLIMYGNANTVKEEILGLTPRYNSLSGTTASQIISAGGADATSNTSIWLTVWGDGACGVFYPKGGRGGLEQEDLGICDTLDAAGNKFRTYDELLRMQLGLCVEDYRYAVRVANVKVSDLKAGTGTQATTATTFLLDLMQQAMSHIPSQNKGRAVYIANRSVKMMLPILARRQGTTGYITYEQVTDQFGAVRPGSVAGNGTGIIGGQMMFQGVPVLTVDQILNTEAVVS